MADITIKRQIDERYRRYALYVIESRGIPNWYDSLTNVQRILIDNCPSSFNKTLSVVGAAISAGYHSGDASLVSTINRLARPFNCAEPIMIGDGFFGCPVSPNAASARYTSVKMNPKMRQIVDKYYHLNTKNEEELYDNLIVDLPFGLSAGVMGIAVGYKSTILPRKVEDIQEFFEGKRKNVNPYFKGFTGKISKYGDNKTWLVEGNLRIDEQEREIKVTCLPPLVKFESFLKKVSSMLNGIDFDFVNNSSDEVDVTIKISKREDVDVWLEVKNQIEKATKIIVHESIVFIRNKTVIEYERLEDYLLDFKDEIERTKLHHLNWTVIKESSELDFLRAKLEYLKFMVAKKRTDSEIDEFLKKFERPISNRLDSIKLRQLSNEEVNRTTSLIKEQEQKLKELIRLNKEQEKLVSSMKFELRGKKIKPAEQLFNNESVNGIEVFSIEEEPEQETEV
jgi:DNA gyrase/topoisomerase IV subunit A